MNSKNFRKYEEKDFSAIYRIWQECGWLEEKMEDVLKDIISACRVRVGELEGSVEASAMATDGIIHYQEEALRTSIINAVTVSLVARKAGLARKALAGLLQAEAEAGNLISVLGIFEQGYYNKLGYGNGTYFRQIHFDPANFQVPVTCRTPQRLKQEDYKILHQNRLERKVLHGRVEMLSEVSTKSEMQFHKNSFGFGYYDAAGKLSHHLWLSPKSLENGPVTVTWMAYQNNNQLLELLALLQTFNNQMRKISLTEPADIQITDFLKKPIHSKEITEGGKYPNYLNSFVYWQMRMLDAAGCMRNTHLPVENLEFNLELHDPVSTLLDKKGKWQGCGGEYFVRLGENSEMESGFRQGLPLLKAGIGAFSRMWLGVKPASGLAASDELSGEERLLQKLDRAFRLPEPQPDWWF